MYISIFFLHFLLMAVFVVVPSGLEAEAGIARERHALSYLGALVLSVPGIYFLVQGRRYLSAHSQLLFVSLCCSQDWLPCHWVVSLGHLWGCCFFHGLYGVGSDVALVGYHLRASRITRHRHGRFCLFTIYRCLFGGMLGGALLDQAGVMGVWLGMSALTLVWATVLGVSHLASPDSVKVA